METFGATVIDHWDGDVSRKFPFFMVGFGIFACGCVRGGSGKLRLVPPPSSVAGLRESKFLKKKASGALCLLLLRWFLFRCY